MSDKEQLAEGEKLPSKSLKWWFIIVLAILLVVLVFWWWVNDGGETGFNINNAVSYYSQ